MTAKSIMILGTCSNAGKSLIAAGIGRVLTDMGMRVAPFKAQNMALNSYVTEDGLEMGRAQVVQAEACRRKPEARMNPVLLKPTSEKGSQVILNGRVYDNLTARDYYAKKPVFLEAVLDAYRSLAAENDVIVLEGAGSCSEINLKENDIVNMGLAKKIGAPALIVGDIDRGGVFGALAGTMLLFDEEERRHAKGVIINKFRGDVSILRPGLKQLEDIIRRPVLGVVPWTELDIDDEDSLSDRLARREAGGDLDIAVIRLPRISNFTDFNPLSYIDGVGVRYVTRPRELGRPDAVILPGTKNTMGDLKWLRESGMEAKILQFAGRGGVVLGICGGYQMLGKKIEDPEGAEGGGVLRGMGLLPHATVFSREKTQRETTGVLAPVGGVLAGLSGLKCRGYEIHMGRSGGGPNLVSRGNVYGTYLHGFFDESGVAKAFCGALLEEKGLDAGAVRAFDAEEYKQSQYDVLARVLRESLDMERICKIIEEGV